MRSGSNCAIILRDAVGLESAGSSVAFDAIRFINTQQLGSINDNNLVAMPKEIIVHPAYPNPFNANTIIQYQTQQTRKIDVSIFDVSGKHINTLVNELKNPGDYAIAWDGFNYNNQVVPSGIYYCVVTSNGYRQAQKIILLK